MTPENSSSYSSTNPRNRGSGNYSSLLSTTALPSLEDASILIKQKPNSKPVLPPLNSNNNRHGTKPPLFSASSSSSSSSYPSVDISLPSLNISARIPSSAQTAKMNEPPTSSPTRSPTSLRGGDDSQPSDRKHSPTSPTSSSGHHPPSKKPRRKKVDHACVYCRRSHMTCDENRPCTRCIRRNIGHLCHDEPKKRSSSQGASSQSPTSTELHPTAAHQPTALVLTASQSPTSSLVFQKLEPKHSSSSSANRASEATDSSEPLTMNTSTPISALTASGSMSALSQHDTSASNNSNANSSSPNSTFKSLPSNNSLVPYPSTNSSNTNTMGSELSRSNTGFGSNNNSNSGTNLAGANNTNSGGPLSSRSSFLNDWFGPQSILSQTSEFNQNLFFSEHANSEFASLGDFLTMIESPDILLNTGGTDPNVNGLNSNNSSGFNSLSISPHISRKTSATDITKLSQALGISAFNQNSSHGNGNHEDNVNFQGSDMAMGGAQLNGNGQVENFHNSGQQAVMFSNSQQQQQQQQNHHHQQDNSNLSHSGSNTSLSNLNNQGSSQHPVVSDSARDKFFLTAADPTVDISPEERLKQVIRAKVVAGLLQPFNYARGYARLQKYMDNYMNQSSRQRILKPLSVFRPAFRAVAQSLLDVDLVMVEESFERMLLDYDRVFTSMAIPACLWRRTGEIYRGNKEFAGLVEVSVDDLRDGKLAIYELMSEESAVNYWEKYGSIAFDTSQKAVLTSCNLRTRDGRKRRACCFSFTIQRDRYNIPSCIVGNFIPIHP